MSKIIVYLSHGVEVSFPSCLFEDVNKLSDEEILKVKPHENGVGIVWEKEPENVYIEWTLFCPTKNDQLKVEAVGVVEDIDYEKLATEADIEYERGLAEGIKIMLEDQDSFPLMTKEELKEKRETYKQLLIKHNIGLHWVDFFFGEEVKEAQDDTTTTAS